MRPPEKPKLVKYFINRQNYVENFMNLVNKRDVVQFIGDTLSVYGTGKTTMLSALYDELVDHDELRPVWLTLSRFSVHYQNTRISQGEDELEIWAQNLTDYYHLLEELCRDLFPQSHLPSEMQKTAQRILHQHWPQSSQKTVTIDTWLALAEDIAEAQEPTITLAQFKKAARELVMSITRLFLEEFRLLSKSRRTVLFADDYCWISDQPIGDWVLNELAREMPDTMVVISRTTDELDVRDPDQRHVESLPLTNFTPEEVAEYLEKRLERDLLPPFMVERVYHFSKGHAQTVCLMADLIKYSPNGDVLLEAFTTPEDYQKALPRLFMDLVATTDTPWIQEMLRLGIVSRRMTADMLYDLLIEDYQDALETGLGVALDNLLQADHEADEGADADADDVDDESDTPITRAIKARILTELDKYSFIEMYHDETGVYYAFHTYFREFVNDYLREEQPDLHLELHVRLRGYYYDLMQGYEDADSRYVQLYRYEDQSWQATVSEWLYHVGHDPDWQKADFEFTNIYFIAFQWWEYYADFPFCQHLVQQWEWTQERGDNRIYPLIERFHRICPRGLSNHTQGDERWIEAGELLTQIRHQLDLDTIAASDDDEVDEEMREEAGDLLKALGEVQNWSLRLRPQPDYITAEQTYRQIIAEARVERDDYNYTYQSAYLADMLFNIGRYDEAIEMALDCNTYSNADKKFNIERDYEVLTLSYRVLGDVALAQKRWHDIATHYIRASMCGYAQNFSLAQPPDPYTVKWYHDNCHLMTQRLIDAAQPDVIWPVIERIHAAWQSYWDEFPCEVSIDVAKASLNNQRTIILRDYLFPPDMDAHDARWQQNAIIEAEHNRIAGMFGVDLQDDDDDA